MVIALAGTALLLVHLRAEQTRCAARILSLESKWVDLRREWWSLQTRAARLRTPQRLRERVTLLDAPLVGPEKNAVPQARARLASHGQVE